MISNQMKKLLFLLFFTIYVNVQNYEGYLSIKVNKIIIKDNKTLEKQRKGEYKGFVIVMLSIVIGTILCFIACKLCQHCLSKMDKIVF